MKAIMLFIMLNVYLTVQGQPDFVIRNNLERIENHILETGTDLTAVNYIKEIKNLQTEIEQIEIDLLGKPRKDIPREKRLGTMKKLRAHPWWLILVREVICYRNELEPYLSKNYSEYRDYYSKLNH